MLANYDSMSCDIRRARLVAAADAVMSGADYFPYIFDRDDFDDVAIILSDRGFYDRAPMRPEIVGP